MMITNNFVLLFMFYTARRLKAIFDAVVLKLVFI